MNPAPVLCCLNSNSSRIRRRIALTTVFILYAVTRLFSQTKPVEGSVISGVSVEKISFVSVSWKKAGFGMVTDSAGGFSLSPRYALDTLIVSHVGYNTIYLPIHRGQEYGSLILQLTEKTTSEVVVNKKYNRGLLWWKKIVQHKARNNPYQFRDFSCDRYTKLEMDLTNITKEGF